MVSIMKKMMANCHFTSNLLGSVMRKNGCRKVYLRKKSRYIFEMVCGFPSCRDRRLRHHYTGYTPFAYVGGGEGLGVSVIDISWSPLFGLSAQLVA
jgi:hypothetical protein